MVWLDNLADVVANAIGQFLQFAGLDPKWGTIFSALAGGIVSFFIVIGYFRGARHAHYGELDTIYFDLLKMRAERPYVVDGDYSRANPPTGSGETALRREQQEQYSYMMWTLLETIYDRAVESKRLQLTWQPIIRTEGEAHLGYLADPTHGRERQKAFQTGFLNFIKRGGFGEYTHDKREIEENQVFAEKVQAKLGSPPGRTLRQKLRSFYRRRRNFLLALLIAICGGLVVAYLSFGVRL